jgi:glycosyltransferase involved in cell wall biosynthesis
VRNPVLQILRLMRPNCNPAQTVGPDDAIQVPANSNTVEARKLSIVGVDPELGFAGGETQVLGLTTTLAAGGHRAELICDPAGRLWEQAVAAGIRCHPIRIRNAIDLAAGVRLRAILKRERYDVVHFHTSRAHSLAPFARGFGSALVVTRRMDYRPNRVFAPYLFNRAVDGVVAISGGVADSLAAAGVDRRRVTVVHSGVDCNRFRPPTDGERVRARIALGVSHGEFVIAAVGALEPRKGHRYLIEAIAQLAATAPSVKVKCFIAGHGSIRRELERQIAKVGSAERVKLLGRVEDTRELLWAADVFAMPSLKEGLGVAALEAMASALPVIASNVGGLREVVENDRTGILVPPANDPAIASAISRLVEERGPGANMGAAARARAVENYSMSTMAARTLALYRECVSKTRGERGEVT